jgi:hypothetical protein
MMNTLTRHHRAELQPSHRSDHRLSRCGYLAANARLDVEFRITPHVSVVPRLTVTAFPSLLDDSGLAPRMLMARPEIAAHWRF